MPVRGGAAEPATSRIVEPSGDERSVEAEDAAGGVSAAGTEKAATRVEGERAQRRVIVGTTNANARGESAGRDDAERLVRPSAQSRERSAAVLDEAAIDPSLRFVLVAALIFAVFVVVLLLSFTLR